MANDLVSVVLPTFNRAELLVRAVGSALAQTHRRLEVIIVDDGSTDGTESRVQALQDSRIRYYRFPQNCGGNRARNKGVELASGPYVAFLDSDDLWLPKKIELQIQMFNEIGNPKAVIYTQIYQKFGNRSLIKPRSGIGAETVAEYLFVHSGVMTTPSLFLSRQFASEITWDETLSRHQDYDFYFQVESLGGKFYLLAQPLIVVDVDVRRSDRVSRAVNPDSSLAFLESRRHNFTERSAKGFLARNVAQQVAQNGEKIRGIMMTYAAWRSNAIRVSECIIIIGKCLVPAWAEEGARRVVARLQGARQAKPRLPDEQRP